MHTEHKIREKLNTGGSRFPEVPAKEVPMNEVTFIRPSLAKEFTGRHPHVRYVDPVCRAHPHQGCRWAHPGGSPPVPRRGPAGEAGPAGCRRTAQLPSGGRGDHLPGRDHDDGQADPRGRLESRRAAAEAQRAARPAHRPVLGSRHGDRRHEHGSAVDGGQRGRRRAVHRQPVTDTALPQASLHLDARGEARPRRDGRKAPEARKRGGDDDLSSPGPAPRRPAPPGGWTSRYPEHSWTPGCSSGTTRRR